MDTNNVKRWITEPLEKIYSKRTTQVLRYLTVLAIVWMILFTPFQMAGQASKQTSISSVIPQPEQASGQALYKDLYLQKYSMFNLTNFMISLLLTSKNLGDHNVYGNGIPQAYTAYKALYDTDYPQLTSYSYSQKSSHSIIINTVIAEQSGIDNCTFRQANQNTAFSNNQTCNGITLLPSISNNFDQAYYSFYVDNVSSFLQLKLYFTDLNFHQSEFTIQLNVELTSQIISSNTTFANGSYVIGPGYQNPSNTTPPDSIIGTLRQSTNTRTNTTSGIELLGVLLGIILLSITRKKNLK